MNEMSQAQQAQKCRNEDCENRGGDITVSGEACGPIRNTLCRQCRQNLGGADVVIFEIATRKVTQVTGFNMARAKRFNIADEDNADRRLEMVKDQFGAGSELDVAIVKPGRYDADDVLPLGVEEPVIKSLKIGG
jgi:hypothetical protein